MSPDPICTCGATELAIIGTASRSDQRFDIHTECGCGKTATFIGGPVTTLSYPPRDDEVVAEQPMPQDPPLTTP